jgi:hypothetical protein
VLLAELEIWHTRPITPTRRVSIGSRVMPVRPAPGFGGLLLAGIVAAHIEHLHPDLHPELQRLMGDLEEGRRIPQPRLRHRFQADRVGLARSRHRLVGNGDSVELELDDHGAAAAQILGAVYAAGELEGRDRPVVMAGLRRAMQWRGPVGPAMIAHLSGARTSMWNPRAFADPQAWALGVLGFTNGHVPTRAAVQQRFRSLVREAHPDHGAAGEGAAQRIVDLGEARRILLHR